MQLVLNLCKAVGMWFLNSLLVTIMNYNVVVLPENGNVHHKRASHLHNMMDANTIRGRQI